MLPPDEEAFVDDVQPLVDFVIVDDERLDVLLPLKLVHFDQRVAQVVATADPVRVNLADGPLQLIERKPFLELFDVGGEDRVQDPFVHFELRAVEALREALKEGQVDGR